MGLILDPNINLPRIFFVFSLNSLSNLYSNLKIATHLSIKKGLKSCLGDAVRNLEDISG